MARCIDVSFYGLFMDADVLRARGLDPVAVRRASVTGMSLRLGERATLVEDAAGCVHGMLMALSHAEIDALYAEPSVRTYRADPVMATLSDGSPVPALCFNLPVPPQANETNAEYAVKLAALARRLGLPEDYIENIR